MKKEFNKHFATSPDFYDSYTIRFLESDNETRKQTKSHWLKCHAENLASGRNDLIIFTTKILAAISVAEAIISE